MSRQSLVVCQAFGLRFLNVLPRRQSSAEAGGLRLSDATRSTSDGKGREGAEERCDVMMNAVVNERLFSSRSQTRTRHYGGRRGRGSGCEAEKEEADESRAHDH